MEPRLYRRQ